MTTQTISNRGLRGVLFAGEIAILVWLIATEGLAGLGLVAVCILAAVALVVAALSRWPAGAVLTLIIASAMPRFSGSIFGLHVRPEHVAAGLILVILALKMVGGTAFNWRVIEKFDYYLIAYVALNFLTSAFTSPQPSMTLRWALLNAIIVSPFFIIRFLLPDLTQAINSVQLLLWVGLAEAIVGILCFVSALLFHTTLGISADQYGFAPGLYGTHYEANIFGSYAGCAAILFFCFFLMTTPGQRTKYAWGMAITLFAAFLSLARSVILAMPVAAIFVMWIAYKSHRMQLRTMIRLVAVVGIVFLAMSPFLIGSLSERFSTLNVNDLSSDSSSLVRLVQTAVGIEDVKAHPWLGTGTASFQLLFKWDDYMPGMGGDSDQGGWLGNTPLRILHDTGVIGLGVFLSFIGYLAWATRTAYKTADANVRTALAALSGGLILYAITFQATEATMLAFTWIHFGLLASIASSEKLRVAALTRI